MNAYGRPVRVSDVDDVYAAWALYRDKLGDLLEAIADDGILTRGEAASFETDQRPTLNLYSRLAATRHAPFIGAPIDN